MAIWWFKLSSKGSKGTDLRRRDDMTFVEEMEVGGLLYRTTNTGLRWENAALCEAGAER